MTYVVTFDHYRPGKRTDGIPFTSVEIYESDTEDGTYTLIDTQSLVPVDSDPTKPAVRNFTTTEATLADGWYYVSFVDDEDNRQNTDPVRRGLTTVGLYYASADAVRDHLDVTPEQLSDAELARPIRLAQSDIDAACGNWRVYEDTGLKFASVDYELTDFQALMLSQATCEQVEYRLTVGDDFMIRDQYESQGGPGYSTAGTLRKVSPRAYSKLQAGGFLRLTGHVSNRLVRALGDLPRAN